MADLNQLPSETLKAACAEQRRIAELLAQLEARRLEIAERAYSDPEDLGTLRELGLIRGSLESMLRGLR